jgi:transcriptional regulator with XRE-family HTH domain
MSDFGQRLKSSRKQLGITQKQLAESLEIAQSTIANYEKNTRFPGELSLRQLSDFLNVSIDYLLGLSESPSSEIKPGTTKHNITFDGDFNALQLELIEMLLSGNEMLATSKILAVSQVVDHHLILIENVYIPLLRTVGILWENGEVSIAEEHFISNVVDRWLTMTSTTSNNTPKKHSAAFIVPSGEEHVLILKMIREYFRFNNWRTYYLGNSVPISSLSSFIDTMNIDLIVLSISIKSHLNSAEHLIKAIKGQPLKRQPKILVGGSAIEDGHQAYDFLSADYYVKRISDIHDFISQLETNLK